MPSEWTSARVISHWDSPWKLIQLKFLICPVSARNLNIMHAAQSWFPSLGEQGCSMLQRVPPPAGCGVLLWLADSIRFVKCAPFAIESRNYGVSGRFASLVDLPGGWRTWTTPAPHYRRPVSSLKCAASPRTTRQRGSRVCFGA